MKKCKSGYYSGRKGINEFPRAWCLLRKSQYEF